MLVDVSYKVGGSDLCSTAAVGQAMEAGKVVKPETRDLMWTAQKTRDGMLVVLQSVRGLASGARGFRMGHEPFDRPAGRVRFPHHPLERRARRRVFCCD